MKTEALTMLQTELKAWDWYSHDIFNTIGGHYYNLTIVIDFHNERPTYQKMWINGTFLRTTHFGKPSKAMINQVRWLIIKAAQSCKQVEGMRLILRSLL